MVPKTEVAVHVSSPGKELSWIDRVYQKLENMCVEVDKNPSLLIQETSKYVENQMNVVGTNVKKLCAELIQDLLPPPMLSPDGVDKKECPIHSKCDCLVSEKPKQKPSNEKTYEGGVTKSGMQHLYAKATNMVESVDAGKIELQSKQVKVEEPKAQVREIAVASDQQRSSVEAVKHVQDTEGLPIKVSNESELEGQRQSRGHMISEDQFYKLSEGEKEAKKSRYEGLKGTTIEVARQEESGNEFECLGDVNGQGERVSGILGDICRTETSVEVEPIGISFQGESALEGDIESKIEIAHVCGDSSIVSSLSADSSIVSPFTADSSIVVPLSACDTQNASKDRRTIWDENIDVPKLEHSSGTCMPKIEGGSTPTSISSDLLNDNSVIFNEEDSVTVSAYLVTEACADEEQSAHWLVSESQRNIFQSDISFLSLVDKIQQAQCILEEFDSDWELV